MHERFLTPAECEAIGEIARSTASKCGRDLSGDGEYVMGGGCERRLPDGRYVRIRVTLMDNEEMFELGLEPDRTLPLFPG
jgi:hypothetical protein